MKKLSILFLITLTCTAVQASEITDTLYNVKEVITDYNFYKGTTNNEYFPYRSVIQSNLSGNANTTNYYGMCQDFKNNSINTGTLDYLQAIIKRIEK